jgi:predicted Zn finger-like uncharacterized protein
MIVTCKTCQKRYLIEKDDIGSKGRQVRCVSCGYSWQQYPIEETVVTIPPRPATFDPGYMAEVRERKKFPWMILLGGVFTIAFSFYIARVPIVSEWPTAEKIFAALKIPVYSPHEGLVLESVIPLQIDQINGPAYALKGELSNEANEVRTIPTFEIIAQGNCKYAGPISRLHSLIRSMKAKLLNQSSKLDSLCILETWNYRLTETRIFPGEKITFETPPRPAVTGATDISIEF